MKPLTFTIDAHRSTHLRVRVKVWATYKLLNRARRKLGKAVLCDGFCHRFHQRHCDDLIIAEIHLARGHLSIDTIAHEASHAAVGYAEWVRPKEDDRHGEFDVRCAAVDECLAYSTGYITEGIVYFLRKNRLKIKPL